MIIQKRTTKEIFAIWIIKIRIKIVKIYFFNSAELKFQIFIFYIKILYLLFKLFISITINIFKIT